jgi:sugar O-acyltransferase (sialic acid O-acetyltransferase NeuD family)
MLQPWCAVAHRRDEQKPRTGKEFSMEKEKVVIFGITEQAMMSHFYLTHDSPHEVAAFTVDRDFITKETLFGLPVIPFEDVESIYPPSEYKMLVAILFSRMNRARAEKYYEAKSKGYSLISYISSKATTWPGLVVGDNCFINENSVIQPFVEIGDDVVITCGSIISHHVVIKDHCFVGDQAVLLGGVTLEPYCVVAANATIRDYVTVARECMIGADALILKDTQERGVYKGTPAELLPKRSNELRFKRDKLRRAGLEKLDSGIRGEVALQ